MARVISSDDMDFATYMAQTESKQKVRPAREWIEQLRDSVGHKKREVKAYLPWVKSHRLFAFRPGEVTCWAGVNGHGKSLLTGMATLSLLSQEQRVCVASFEMKPPATLERMARQHSGMRPLLEHETSPEMVGLMRECLDQFAIATDNHLWLYDQQGAVETKTLLGVIRYAATELRCTHFVIDSLMKCVRGTDDYNGQKDFLDDLCAAARDLGIHIHLVHHIRKLSAETQIPDKNDVKGAGEIVDQIDNLLLVWRNKRKEKDLQAGKLVADTEADALLICDKQRNGEWEGKIALWFDAESQQFVGSVGGARMDFNRFPHGDA